MSGIISAKMADHIDALRQSKIRATPGRVAVMGVLEKADVPVDVAYIVKRVNTDSEGYDQATVYRAVEALVKEGVIKQVDFREGKYRYELEGDHHHHLVCKNCGTVTPVYDKCLAMTDSQISQKYNFNVSEHHLEFFGLCSRCCA